MTMTRSNTAAEILVCPYPLGWPCPGHHRWRYHVCLPVQVGATPRGRPILVWSNDARVA